jgi:hypothetical protein
VTGFNIQVNDAGLPARLEKLALFLQDLRSFWPLLVPVVTGWWRQQFATEGEFGGAHWADLSPEYAARKAQQHPGAGILVATGAMKRAASAPERRQTPTELVLTIADSTLPYHQAGSDRMPARPLVFGSPLPAGPQAELDAVAETYVRDLLARL